jgi:predicted membrane chloride channel (bestrophin family)
MCHLRAGEDLEKELTGKLLPAELSALLASAHRPNYCMQVMTAVIRAAQLPGGQVDHRDSTANVKASAAFRMDENLTQFSDVTGGCERILRTPVPLSYSRHNSRFLIIWLTLLPFTLWDQCHWFTLPVTTLVAFLLLGIKEIGVVVEEPFSILPLERIADTIETNVWELHATHSAKAVAEQAAARASGQPSPLVDANDLVYTVVPADQLKQGGAGEGAAVYGVAWNGVGATVRARAASVAK